MHSLSIQIHRLLETLESTAWSALILQGHHKVLKSEVIFPGESWAVQSTGSALRPWTKHSL